MKSFARIFAVAILISAASAAQAAEDIFPQDGDFLLRTLVQTFPSPIKTLSLEVSRPSGTFSNAQLTALGAKTLPFSISGQAATPIKVSFKNKSGEKFQCLAAVLRDSKSFKGLSLGPFSGRTATVFIENCKADRVLTYKIQYDVVLNLDKSIPFSNMSKSKTFAISEGLKPESRVLYCMSPMNADGVPNYALAIYDTGEHYVLGISIQPSGSVKSSLSTSVAPNEFDFPIGVSAPHDIDSVAYELLPSLEFFQKLSGQVQIVFSKQNCVKEGFNDDWPRLNCQTDVPETFQRSGIKKLSFQFSKRILVTKVQGRMVEGTNFDTSLKLTSKELNPNRLSKVFSNSVQFEKDMNGANPESGCQWRAH